MHSMCNNKTILTNSMPSTSDNGSFPITNKHLRQRKNVRAVTLSHSEDIVIGHRHKKKSVEALSGYESGESDVEETGSSLASFSRVNKRGAPEKTSIKDVRCTNIQFDESSSRDSDGLFTRLNSKRGSMKALSDFKTGDSMEQAKASLSNLSRVNQNLDHCTNSSQQNDDLDLSSENDSVYKIMINACKKRYHNLLSTSDSSDSDTPVKQQRFRKRKRINSSSEDENVNEAQTQRRGRPSQYDLPRTNELIHTRQLRPRVTNRSPYRATVSGSSSYERMIRSESTEADRYGGIEILERMIRGDIDGFSTTISSNSSQANVMDGLSSDDQLNGRGVEIRELFQTQNFIPPVFRRRSGRIRVQREITIEGRSETSSDESSAFRGFDNVPQPLQSSDDSSASDTTLPFAARRARGGNVQLRYSDSDSNSEQTLPHFIDHSITGNTGVSLNTLIPSIIPSDDSSDCDADSEKCPICFGSFGSKEVASPESCDHSFCTKCIEEWAKSNNTCPIDRKHFNRIVVSRSFNNNEVLREILVQSPVLRFWDIGNDIAEYIGVAAMDLDMSSESSEEELEEICCVCFSSENFQNLILCDSCNNIYHLSCLNPPLRYVPANNWFCPQCMVV